MFFYGYRTWRSQADTDQEASPSWLAFTALDRQSWIEGAMQAAEEGKPLTVLPSCESCELTTLVTLRPSVQSWRRRHGRGHRFPFGFKAHSTGRNARPVQQNWPRTHCWEVIAVYSMDVTSNCHLNSLLSLYGARRPHQMPRRCWHCASSSL